MLSARNQAYITDGPWRVPGLPLLPASHQHEIYLAYLTAAVLCQHVLHVHSRVDQVDDWPLDGPFNGWLCQCANLLAN